MYNLYRAQWEVGHHSAMREAARHGRVFRPSSSVEDALNQKRNTPFLEGAPRFWMRYLLSLSLQSQHVSFRSHLTSSPEHRFGVLYQHQPPPKTRTPAALALTCYTRAYYQPAGPLEKGPWRVRGGERGQTWACAAPGSHPTATASAWAPALGGHGGCWPHRASQQNQIKCTERGRTRAGGAVP